MSHGRVKGLVFGSPCGRKRSTFRTYKAAMKALRRQQDPDGRVYRGPCCGWYHLTRYSIDEFAQRVADGCTDFESHDTVVSIREEEHREETWTDQPAAAGGGTEGLEPGAGGARPRDEAFLRRESARSTPSPAAFARFLARRGAA